jgi:thiol-disulfide isomerase/thioredoxin
MLSGMGIRTWLARVVVSVAPFGAASLVTVLASPAAMADSSDARPWLGVAMDVDAQNPGVRVGHVVKGSPADKAGLREGDRVLRVSGTAVARGSDVVRVVSTLGVGDTVELAFARAGREQTVRATLAPFPSPDDMMRMDLVGSFAPGWKDVVGVSGAFPATLAAEHGRVVLLDFWATWCAPCRVSIPTLDALQARYGAQGLTVLGVSTEEEQEVALFTRHAAMRYGVAVDREGQTTRAYGVVSLPTLVIIDKRGVVRDIAIGVDPGLDARLDATVRSLLAEPAPAN